MSWIKVSDRLPSEKECDINSGWFLVCREGHKRCDISRFDGWVDPAYQHNWKNPYDIHVTHWMPLPDFPDEYKT